MNAARALTVKEAAAILGCGGSTLYEQINAGECPIPVIRFGRAKRLPAAQVEFLAMFGRAPESTDELVAFVKSMGADVATFENGNGPVAADTAPGQ